jgi:hypothetical protein
VAGSVIQALMAVVTIAAGTPAVGLVACLTIAMCMVLVVVAEVFAFYRVGLPPTEPVRVQELRMSGSHRPQDLV